MRKLIPDRSSFPDDQSPLFLRAIADDAADGRGNAAQMALRRVIDMRFETTVSRVVLTFARDAFEAR
jgi:hypothetical protein